MLTSYGNKQCLQWEEKINIRLFNQGGNCSMLYVSGSKLLAEKGENAKELKKKKSHFCSAPPMLENDVHVVITRV